jgi:release factor glutamine methyltransferase
LKKDSWTLLEVLRWTTGRFEERGLATPRLDAEILIAAALRLSRVQLYVQFERPLAAAELGAIREHVRRRQSGESVAYVVGHKEFFGLEFAVDHRVLVPRPDTETLVDEALARVRERFAVAAPREASDEASAEASVRNGSETAPAPLGDGAPAETATLPQPAVAPESAPAFTVRIADIGTGSGAIAITLAKQLPQAEVYAVDLSAPALEVAHSNAARHNVAVTFLEGDLTQPLGPQGPFDLIVANLPYVPSAEIDGLAAEVRSEPRAALDGGADGLDLLRRLVRAAPALLTMGGALVLEIGAGQAQQTAQLCRDAGFIDTRLRRDLGAIERVISAVKP